MTSNSRERFLEFLPLFLLGLITLGIEKGMIPMENNWHAYIYLALMNLVGFWLIWSVIKRLRNKFEGINRSLIDTNVV